MYRFGKRPPRSLESFGVSGLLGEECGVFYNNVYGIRHVGRVSDLLAARLRKAGLDELKLRALLLFGVFEAYGTQPKPQAVQSKDGTTEEEPPLATPLVVECGIDGEKVAVGVSFTLPPEGGVNPEGLTERLAKGEPGDAFEGLLAQLDKLADRVVVRVQPAAKRAEVVALIGIPGQMDASALGEHLPLEVVVIQSSEVPEAPPATSYTELGDLDYPKLLRDDSPGKDKSKAPPPGTGEVLAKNVADATAKEKVEGKADKDGAVRIKGVTQKIGEDGVAVKGAAGEDDGDTVAIEGGEEGEGGGARAAKGQGKKRRGLRALFSRKAADEGEAGEGGGDGPGTEDGEPALVVAGKGAAEEKVKLVKGKGEDPAAAVMKLKGDGEEEQSDAVVVSSNSVESGGAAVQVIKVQGGAAAPAPTYGARSAQAAGAADVPGEGLAAEARMKSDGEAAVASLAVADAEIKGYQNRIAGLEARLAELEAEKAAAARAGGRYVVHEEQKGLRGLLSKIWPFRQKRGEEFEEQGDGEGDFEEGTEPGAAGGKAAGDLDAGEAALAEAAEKVAAQAGGANPEAIASSLVREIQAGHLDRTIAKAKAEAADIKKDLRTERAKRWLDGLMGDLVAEKGRLHDSAKKLNLTIRQKELEFRNKELAFQEELRRRDEALRQKENALTRAKDQMSQISGNMDKLRELTANAADDVHYKQKYNFVQKMMQATKDDNALLQRKVEELKSQVAAANINAKSRSNMAEYAALQTKYERMQKQTDEYRKVNQQLLEKVNEAKRDRAASGNPDEMRRRLDAAMKMVATSRRDSDAAQTKMKDMASEEIRLKNELSRALTELKTLRAVARSTGGRQGGGGAGGKAA